MCRVVFHITALGRVRVRTHQEYRSIVMSYHPGSGRQLYE